MNPVVPRAAPVMGALAFVTLAACSGPSPETPPKAQLIQDLTMFASGGTLGRAELDKRTKAFEAGTLTLAAYIDEMLDKPLGARFAKELVISTNETRKEKYPLTANNILRSSQDGGQPVYYLRKPCDVTSAVKVTPWWGGGDVLVCPDSYRPEVKGDTHNRTCGASMLAPKDEDICGCGPLLMYCTRDGEQFKEIQDDIEQEVFDTAGYVVDRDRPIEDVFTMNETVRNASVEMLYRRARIAAGEPETLLPVTDFGTKAELHPRVDMVPGQHAGVLSTPYMTYSSDALRGVMRNDLDYLFCVGVSSSRVTTEAILGLDVVDLREGDGWKKLAAMPICTDCHARLDYSMQFFWGYPSSYNGIDYRPSLARTGQGPLYVYNIDDERGTAELTPGGFAKLAVKQPEFGKCMTKKIVDHVFNGGETAADFKAVLDTFESTHRAKAMLKTAMLRYAEANKSGRPASPVRAPSSEGAAQVATASGDNHVAISKTLRARMDDDCMQCHDKDDAVDFTPDTQSRAMLVRMMDKVGFGGMPKNAQGLDDSERRAFLDAVAPLAFPDIHDRVQALDYFANGLRGYSVHRYRTAMSNVHARAGGQGKAFRAGGIEGDIPQALASYTPSIAVESAATALRGCKAAKLAGRELEACVERATSPGGIIVGAVVDP